MAPFPSVWRNRGSAPHVAAPVRWYRGYVAAQQRHPGLFLATQLAYAILFSTWLVLSHTWPAPDVVVVGLLCFAVLTARGVSFLRDWTPFLVLLIAYAALPGFAPGLAQRTHVGMPITVDRWLGGGELPTTRLQAALWDAGRLHWYDYLATMLYLVHFITPLVVAFVFWVRSRALYWRYVRAYVLLLLAAFATYLLYPMAPPWLASEQQRIPDVHRVLSAVQWQGVSDPIVLLSRYFHTDPVAAMPSMHAAFPVLVWLVLWRVWPRWGWTAVVYPLLMAFAVIYAGEHYLIDVLAGWLYAAVAFALIWVRPPARHHGLRPAAHPTRRLYPRGELAGVPVTSRDPASSGIVLAASGNPDRPAPAGRRRG